MSKHTKGPWRVEFGESLSIRSADDSRLATMNWLRGRNGLGGRLSDEEVAANALVFAAAPALLAVLKEYVRDFGDNEDADSKRMAEKAHAAIRAAEGPDATEEQVRAVSGEPA